MSVISDQIKIITETLPDGVELVAVSKFHPVEALKEAYDAGQRIFGESRVQEISQKRLLMPDDVQWHFIGHLQTNKVRQLVPYVSLIHSVDSIKLLESINAESARIGKVVDVLLQLHVAQEETKFGFTCEDCVDLVDKGVLDRLPNVRVCGVMGMATNTDDMVKVREEFKSIKNVFDTLKQRYFADKPYFKEISMGMSDDFHIAMEEGSTLVRIGTTIFGSRGY
ncbi:MAG: YggS family pyridoxal phosphate-dependent enzyme [Muribaculaceae bacterium]|nr:YggS family pyridoxal phosphate-dependent enzyme [Muribaculaceae bacterium]